MKIVSARLTLSCVSIIVLGLILAGQSEAKIDPKNVMGMWIFEEGTGNVIKDSSGNGNHGEVLGNAKRAGGKFGKGMTFDGVDDYAKVPNAVILNPKKEITVMAWINSPKVTKRYQMIVTKDDLGTVEGQWNLRFELTNANLNFCANIGGAWTNNAGPTKLKNDTWYHVAGTYKDGDGQRLYINGIVDAQNGSSGKLKQDTQEINFGTRQHGKKSYLFQGVMDEVAIFNVALTEDDMNSIMTNGLEKATGITAVSPTGKLATTWDAIKAQ